jgi:hypothetical protein
MNSTPTETQSERVAVEVAPWCKDALFLVTTFGDGECAILVRGWEALCAKVVEVHFHDPEPEQRKAVLDQLVDWEEWEAVADGLPYHFQWFYEDGNVSVTRVTDDEASAVNAHDDLVAALEPFTAWFAHIAATGSRRLDDNEHPPISGAPTMGDLRRAMAAYLIATGAKAYGS